MIEQKEKKLNPQLKARKEFIAKFKNLNEFNRVSQAFTIVQEANKLVRVEVEEFEDPKFITGEYIFENYFARRENFQKYDVS